MDTPNNTKDNLTLYLPDYQLKERDTVRGYDMIGTPTVGPVAREGGVDDVVRDASTGIAYRISQLKGPKIVEKEGAHYQDDEEDGEAILPQDPKRCAQVLHRLFDSEDSPTQTQERFQEALPRLFIAFEESFSKKLSEIFASQDENASVEQVVEYIVSKNIPVAEIDLSQIAIGGYKEKENLLPAQRKTAEERSSFQGKLLDALLVHAEDEILKSGLMDPDLKLNLKQKTRSERATIPADHLKVTATLTPGGKIIVNLESPEADSFPG